MHTAQNSLNELREMIPGRVLEVMRDGQRSHQI